VIHRHTHPIVCCQTAIEAPSLVLATTFNNLTSIPFRELDTENQLLA
jgi:hypothetical protein